MNKKQELTISYSEKIAFLFSDIDVDPQGFIECFAFVKEHLEESVDTYMSHKDDDDFYSHLAFWLIYDTQKYAADYAIPKAQKLLDEYWEKVAKLETEKTK